MAPAEVGRADGVGLAADVGLADGAGTARVGSGTGVASSSLPESLSPGGSAAPVGSGTGAAVALGTGVAALVRDGTGAGVAAGSRLVVEVAVGLAAPAEATGTGVADGDVTPPTCAAGPLWDCPVAAIAVPPPMRAIPVTPAITQARLTRDRLLLESMCFSRMWLVVWFVGGKYGRRHGKLCRRGRNLPGRSAVYARTGEQKREGYVG